jgi:hypothetical protein
LTWEGRKSFGSLVRWARGNGVINEDEEKTINKIKQIGDLSAHIAGR